MVLLVALLLLTLALSSLVTGAEMALFSVGESRTRTLVEERFRGSEALASLRAQPERVAVLLRSAGMLADAGAIGAAALLGHRIAGATGLGAGVAAAALLVLIIGKLAPLRPGADKAIPIALSIAPPLASLASLAGPVLGWLAPLVRTVGSPGSPEALTERGVRQITAIGQLQGKIGEHERQVVERAFRLDETNAWTIMMPRVDIFAWQDALTLAEIAPQFHTVPYSRVPVYGESIDDITGVLYLRDAYQALISGQRDVTLRSLAREPLIVPGSVSLTKLLRDFQTRRIHMALVVDEYGGTDGLVTLEDVLEELVGEIVDETDVMKEPILRISRTEIVAAGDADLREINHAFNTALPQLEHRSLNGYLLEELGRVPETGEQLERHGVRVEILEATETQVVRARLRRQPASPDVGPEGPARPTGRPREETRDDPAPPSREADASGTEDESPSDTDDAPSAADRGSRIQA